MTRRAVPGALATVEKAVGYLDEAHAQLLKYRAWVKGFSQTLAEAERVSADLGGQFVWQDELVDFWEPFSVIQGALIALYERLRTVNPALADMVEAYIDPPHNAQIEFATDGAVFRERQGYPRKQIAYKVDRLRIWHRNFAHWIQLAVGEIAVARREMSE